MRTLHTLRPASGKLFAIALCFAAVAPLAHADDASRKAKAAEMLQITKAAPAMQEQLANLRDRVDGMAKQQFGAPSLSTDQSALTAQYMKEVDGILKQEISWDELYPQIVQSYAESFTEPELDGIIAFYKTPAGQAVLSKTPDMVQKTNTLVTGRIKEMQPKLQALTESYAQKMKAASPAAPAGSAKPATPAGTKSTTPAPAPKQ
jgi:hypothetical protein